MKTIFFRKQKAYPNSFWGRMLLFFLKKKLNIVEYLFQKKNLVIYLFLCIGLSSIHASDSTNLKVWIDFIKESDTAFVKGLVVNLDDKAKDFKWEMTIHRETLTVKSNKKLNGQFNAEPFFPKIIAETNFDLKKREYFIVVVNVLDHNDQLIGTDTLVSTSVDPSLKKPPPPNPVVAKQNRPKPKINPDALEIDGLILDETRSKIGRDFYELFYNRWTPPLGAKDFLITIKEIPSRGTGARISIQVNENIVLYRFLQPRGELVEQEANLTISYLKKYLSKNENMKQDMEVGDAMGTGIF